VPDTPLLPSLHRPRVALASLLALIAIALALVAPPRTLAYTHRSACPASSAKQRGHHARACAKRSHRAKARTRRAGRLVLVRPAAAKPRAGANATGGSVRGIVTPPPAPSEELAASCDDGSEPALAAEETFACDDGSEPSCDDGSELTLSSDGSKLLCSGSGSEPEPEAGEPEDGGESAGDSPAPPRQPSPAPRSHRASGS